MERVEEVCHLVHSTRRLALCLVPGPRKWRLLLSLSRAGIPVGECHLHWRIARHYRHFARERLAEEEGQSTTRHTLVLARRYHPLHSRALSFQPPREACSFRPCSGI